MDHRRGSKFLWVFCLLVILLALASGCSKNADSVPLRSESFPLGKQTISLSIPCSLQAGPSVVAEKFRHMIAADLNASGDSDLLHIELRGFLYEKTEFPTGWQPDLEGATADSLGRLAYVNDIEAFESSQANLTISGKPAILANAAFKASGQAREMKALYVLDGFALWTLSLQYSAGDGLARSLADKIVSSVKLAP